MHVSHRLSVQKISERTVVFAAGHAVPVRERPPPTAGAYRKKHAMPIHKVRCDSDGTRAGLIRSAA